MTEVSAAILENEEGEILIGQRGPGGSCGNLWEFPGGKRRPGETPEECLIRECREELACEITCESQPFFETSYRYPDVEVALTFFKGRIAKGEPECKVHRQLIWADPKKLVTYTFCPADEALIKQLINF